MSSGTLTVDSGVTLTITGTYNGSGGTINNQGTIKLSGGSASFPGAGATINNGTANTMSNLEIASSGTVTLTSSIIIGGTLTLTGGKINTGGNVLTVGAISGGSSASYVVGSLKKTALAGAFTFPVGTSVGYTPLDISNATGGGDLTVQPTATVQPNVNAATSLKEYWTLTEAGSLTLDMTFNYLQTDVQGDESGYRIIRVSNGTPVAFPQNCPAVCVDASNNKATIQNVSEFSDWTLGQTVAPTAVRFGAARAESYAEGVLISWGSANEANNLGFNVYRELGGRRVRVNRGVIAGSALTVGAGVELRAGEGYRWWDADGTGAAQYWIEDLDLDGTRTMHGPLTTLAGTGDGRALAARLSQPALLDELNQRAQNDAGVFVTGRPAAAVAPASAGGAGVAEVAPAQQQQWQIAGGSAVKIGVKRDGWYRVMQEELVAAGLDPTADARLLQLYADGRQVPMRLNGVGTNLGAGGSIEFYGQGLDTPTTDTRVYWLVIGTEPGLRLPASRSTGKAGGGDKLLPAEFAPDANGNGATQGASDELDANHAQSLNGTPRAASETQGTSARSFAYTVERKERLLYFSSLLNGDAENYFGQLVSSQPVTETLTIHNLGKVGDKNPARLEVALQGVSAGAHALVVSFNGVELKRFSFNAQEHADETFTVPASLLREGDNEVKLSVAGNVTDLSLVDYLRLTYAHAYRADDNALRFTTQGAGPLTIEGFTGANIHMVDVTDPTSVFELEPRVSATADGFAASVRSAGGRTLFAFTDDLASRPASVAANQSSTWHDKEQGADLVIVTHRTLRESVAPLKTLRESEGLSVAVVDVEDLYDEFSYGAHTPQAIKDFLRWANENWRQSPHYVLFVGDATIDPRNYEGRGAFDLVPTKLIDTASMETASDEWLADFTGEGVASMSLGRLPVRTPQEAAAVVNKIVNFTPMAASQTALLVSDRAGTNDLNFDAATRSVAKLLPPDTATTFVSRNDGTADAVRGEVINGINAGPMIVNFVGHGSTTRWTGDDLLRPSDAATFSNGSRLPLFVMMTCLNGYYTGTVVDSLAEAVLKPAQGGAVAVWASSGTTIPVDQQLVNQELYRLLFNGQSPALGDAVRQAKLLTHDADIRRTWILFGDPSMRVR